MSDFGRTVAGEYRAIRETVEKRPEASQPGGIDGSVKEQILGELDILIGKHETPKRGFDFTTRKGP